MPTKRAQRLTDRVVERAAKEMRERGETGRVMLWDAVVPGFFVRLYPDGRARFGLFYRDPAGRQRWVTVPAITWPAAPLEKGRNAVRRLQNQIADGVDVASERDTARTGETAAEVWESYTAAQAPHWKPSTAAWRADLWENVLEPRFGTRRLKDITRRDLERMHEELADRPTLANHAVATAKALCSWAIDREIVPGPNPAKGIRLYRSQGRERFLSADETRILMRAVDLEESIGGLASVVRPTGEQLEQMAREMEARGETVKRKRDGTPDRRWFAEKGSRGVSPSVALLVRLLLMTGARRGEWQTAKWAFVDWERAALRLPDSKTGRKVIALSAPVLELLKQAWERRQSDEWIIEGLDGDRALVNAARPWKRIVERANLIVNDEREKAGLPALAPGPFTGLRPHDLRHSWISAAVAAGVPLFVAGAAAGHRDTRTTSRYAHAAQSAVEQAHETVAAGIAAAVAGQTARVVDVASPKVAPARKPRKVAAR